jgi:antitoxin ParD1/3/4
LFLRRQTRAARLEELRREIRKGVDSGPAIPAEEVFARLRAKLKAMAPTAEA